MPRCRPSNLDLTNSRKERPAALRETGRDAFLPCKTPTSAGFLNRLKFIPSSMTKDEYMASLDSNKYDEETKRNILFLQSGSFYDDTPYGDHSHLAPPPSSVFSVSMNITPIEHSGVAVGSQEEPNVVEKNTEPMLVIEYMRQYAAAHGVWPKVSVFNDSFIPQELYDSENESTSGDEQHIGENAGGEADDDDEGMEDISPYFTPVVLPANERQEVVEVPSSPPQLPAVIPPIIIPPVPYDDIMSQSSEEDNDNSDDEDFKDPSYDRLQQQLHCQFSNSHPMPELSSPSSSSSRSSSPYLVTPKSSPKRKSTTNDKARTRPKPYSIESSARTRKSSSGSDDAYVPLSSPGPEKDRTPHAPYITFRCKKTGKMIYQCRTCPEIQSKALGDMKRHLEGLKHQKPSHKCDPAKFEFGCGREFTRTDALKRHIKSKHPMGWAVHEWEMDEQEKAESSRGQTKVTK